MTPLARRLQEVRDRIAAACARSGRDPSGVRLVAVTKTVPVEAVAEALDAGQLDFGENRVQEALPKIAAIGPRARWHLVGHLQTNKARHAAGAFELIHSVDDARLAAELDRRAASRGIVQPVLLQVNLAGEATKSGAAADGFVAVLRAAADRPHLDVRGLMTIPPAAADPRSSRRWFAELRDLRDRAAREMGRPLPELSMGMSGDFEVAIEEGATLVRVGTAIFGERG